MDRSVEVRRRDERVPVAGNGRSRQWQAGAGRTYTEYTERMSFGIGSATETKAIGPLSTKQAESGHRHSLWRKGGESELLLDRGPIEVRARFEDAPFEDFCPIRIGDRTRAVEEVGLDSFENPRSV